MVAATPRARNSGRDQSRSCLQSSKPMNPHHAPSTVTGMASTERIPWGSRTARSLSGSGQINVDMSVSDWGTQNQYSTLAGSTQQVISHQFGTEYETVVGTYTVPNDANAWFLQGVVNFLDTTDYDVSLFSIKRSQDTATTTPYRKMSSSAS